MSRQTLLLVFGGESSEHDVSIMSARNVYAALDNSKYDTKLCFIDRSGKWWLLDMWVEDLNHHGGAQLAAVPGAGCLLTIPGNKIVQIDVAFPVLHGENGHEDGAIQGLLGLSHVPFVGSGIAASAFGWDKLYTKRLLAASNVTVTPYIAYSKDEVTPKYEFLSKQLGGEMFVKPTAAGSSVGVSKVRNADELHEAITKALRYSDTILIEQAITGRELEVAVLGNPPHHQESGVGEIIPGEEFYSYDDKYSVTSKAQVLAHADISSELSAQLRQTAHQAYQIIGCRGLARIDFLVSNSGEIYLNEINTLPGFTSISQYPKLWSEQGMKYPELINELISLTDK